MSTYQFRNPEIIALIELNTDYSTPYSHCTRYEMDIGSSIYAHHRDGHSFYSATGRIAVGWCEKIMGVHTKLNGHGHKTWYIKDTHRSCRTWRQRKGEAPKLREGRVQ
jgi:hypothetical protein